MRRLLILLIASMAVSGCGQQSVVDKAENPLAQKPPTFTVMPTAYRPVTPTPSPTPLPTATPTFTPSATSTPTATFTPLPTFTASPVSPLNTSLKKLAASNGIHVGSLIKIEDIRSDPNFEKRLLDQFDMVTINGFGRTYRAPGVFDFSETDPEVNFANQNNLRIRAQPIIYHVTTPRWITDGDWSLRQARDILKEYIHGIVGHYRGRVDVWIIANEIVDDDGNLRQNIWAQTLGPDYVAMAFRWAHEADPNAILLYNEYHLERPGQKADGVFRMVKKMVNDGVPIHGVGFQLHLELGSTPKLAVLQSQMQRFSRLGLIVDVTELDVRLKSPFTEDRLGAQADAYATVMQACLNVRNCKNFTMWGFADANSWIDRKFPGYGAAHIFDENYNPKPAYDALIKVLRQNKP